MVKICVCLNINSFFDRSHRQNLRIFFNLAGRLLSLKFAN